MSYTALYRKFRPDNFEDVKGQEHIVTTLKNQIRHNRLGHAYLFCGTRGTGKTTIAKILGKAVNCENPADGNPCGECRSCKAIAAGNSMNLIEIDAASNNGVDNIREIREEVQYSPAEGKYKVYIIDEVHMLSIGAFNALLKTLEEPPAYVIFILATTEAHKIPITILSRCQRYDFKRISIDTIAARLTELMEIEHVRVEERAIRYVAKAADGSLRDALSLLDQCLAFYMGQDLTYDNVLEVLGAVDAEVFSDFLRKVLSGDTTGCIYKLEELVLSGRDLNQMVVDFTWYMRNLLLVKTSQEAEEVIDVSSDTLELLKQEAAMVETDILMRYIRVFSELSGQIRYSTQKRILIEMALIKLTNPSMEDNLDSLIDRISRIEKKVEQGIAVTPAPSVKRDGGEAVGKRSGGYVRKQPVRPTQEETKKIAGMWREIVLALSDMHRSDVGMMLAGTTADVGMGDNELVIMNCTELAVDFCNSEDGTEAILEAVEKIYGKKVELDIKFMSADDSGESFGFTKNEPEFTMEVEIDDSEEDY
ncbi:MAG: DNA polymerase III subunit gamma/tau [Alistipes sp.]|nr:DNA polymerase III subunit gamma/tau [Alistipes sp.]